MGIQRTPGHIERSNSTLGNRSSLARVVSGQLSTFKQICSRGLLVSLVVKTVKGPLFPSTNQNYYWTCFANFKVPSLLNLNFRYRIKYMDNLLSFFPETFGNSGNFLFHWSYQFARYSGPGCSKAD